MLCPSDVPGHRFLQDIRIQRILYEREEIAGEYLTARVCDNEPPRSTMNVRWQVNYHLLERPTSLGQLDQPQGFDILVVAAGYQFV